MKHFFYLQIYETFFSGGGITILKKNKYFTHRQPLDFGGKNQILGWFSYASYFLLYIFFWFSSKPNTAVREKYIHTENQTLKRGRPSIGVPTFSIIRCRKNPRRIQKTLDFPFGNSQYPWFFFANCKINDERSVYLIFPIG